MLINYNAAYFHLLSEMFDDPGHSIASLHLVSSSVLQKILDEWNQPVKDADMRFIFETVKINAQKNPEKIAIESVLSKMTYAALVYRMERLASIIQSFPVQPDDVVGVMMPRDCYLIVGLLGILMSGCAYTAVLPDFPESRIKYILEEDCKVKIVVTDSSFSSKFTWFSGELIFMDRLSEYPYVKWTNKLSFSNLAYITYTSGSSGSPKGVMVEHGHLVMYTQQDEYNIEGDLYLHSTNVTFDIIVLEVYVPLLRNKSIYVVENLMVSPLQKVCFLQGPSSLLEYVSADVIEVGGCVSQVGERLSHDLLKKFDRILNGYGTAETVNISVGKYLNVYDDVRILGRPLSF
jgi:non-ribosomal peptide synthetase component F